MTPHSCRTLALSHLAPAERPLPRAYKPRLGRVQRIVNTDYVHKLKSTTSAGFVNKAYSPGARGGIFQKAFVHFGKPLIGTTVLCLRYKSNYVAERAHSETKDRERCGLAVTRSRRGRRSNEVPKNHVMENPASGQQARAVQCTLGTHTLSQDFAHYHCRTAVEHIQQTSHISSKHSLFKSSSHSYSHISILASRPSTTSLMSFDIAQETLGDSPTPITDM
ncbi:hypothetical protein EVAR_58737_1 [Eumeta japonica]|uniref:Uncharacterized protein n=1 Tax=Eumeta variegata TaxID=151549 RepID=A0A4C1YWN8_EUMVA|nr:hypothetical protein EVAR_58737_1 [Eumeta japonica]